MTDSTTGPQGPAIDVYTGDDGATVVDIDTTATDNARLRVWVNDGPVYIGTVFDARPDTGDHADLIRPYADELTAALAARHRVKNNLVGEIRRTAAVLHDPEHREHMPVFAARLARSIEQARSHGATDAEIGRAFIDGHSTDCRAAGN